MNVPFMESPEVLRTLPGAVRRIQQISNSILAFYETLVTTLDVRLDRILFPIVRQETISQSFDISQRNSNIQNLLIF